MKFTQLAKRNLKEALTDPLSLGLSIIFPMVLLLVLQTIGAVDDFFNVTNLTPGVVLFGFAMLSLTSGMMLAKDRDTGFVTRLLTAPLRARDFVIGYSLPYIPVTVLQIIVIYGIGWLLGMEINGNAGMLFLILFVMSVGYIALGMILGTVFSYKTVSIAWIAVNLLTIFGGAWFPLEIIGGPIQSSMNVLPFAHAIDSTRDIMLSGAGVGEIAMDILWVTGYTVAFIVLGISFFKRRMVA